MKTIYTTLITILTVSTSFAHSIKSVGNKNWKNASSWNLNRLPNDNDSIIIRSGDTLTIDANLQLDNVVILIYGMLKFDNGKLRLDNNSQVSIQTTGKVVGFNSDDQISIGNTLKFSGTELIKSGFNIANNTTSTSPMGFVSSVLPITFQSFYTARQAGNIQLSWATSSEVNNHSFEIERSTDCRNWKQIATIVGAGTSSLVNKYSFTDRNISEAVVYYRIRQVNMDGSFQYSSVRTIRSSGNVALADIYASSKRTITIEFNSEMKENVTVEILNMNGQMIARKNYNQAAYKLSLNLTANTGIYVVRVSDASGWNEVKKIAL